MSDQQLCELIGLTKKLVELVGERESREVDIVFFTIPEAGGDRTFAIGTTKIDFMSGRITNPNGTVETLDKNLDKYGKLSLHSISIDSDNDVILRINNFPARKVISGFSTQIPWLTYDYIEITCALSTKIQIFACSNPAAVIGQYRQKEGYNTQSAYQKVAGIVVRNSHDAEVITWNMVYTKAKTIILPKGLLGTIRVLFDLKFVPAYGGTIAYGKIYKNGVAIGTEQTDETQAYVTKSEDITIDFNPGDTIELWTKGLLSYVRNFRLSYDNGDAIAVVSINA